MKWLISLLIALLPGVSVGQTIYGTTMFYGRAGRGIVNSTGSGLDTEDIFICFLADTQNQVSMNDFLTDGSGININTSCASTSIDTTCRGANCTKSPYCTQSWGKTASIAMRNLAYDLTGQWAKIDWSSIQGTDAARTPTQPLNHPRCDAIVSLGDMTDIDDAIVDGNPAYSSLTADEKRQVDINLDFWTIIKESGIPFLILRGNHDTRVTLTSLKAALGFTSLPFFYLSEPSLGLSNAIKFKTNTGKSLCIMGDDDGEDDASLSAGQRTTDNNWIIANTGCGDDSPTIVVGHVSAVPSINCAHAVPGYGASGDYRQTLVSDATKSEVFLFAGGHYLTPCADWGQATDAGGWLYTVLYSNWQEMNRHAENFGNVPYGATPSDGAGLYYTVARIRPQASSIRFMPWSPYWQGNDTEQVVESGLYLTSGGTITFDWHTRYP